MNGRHYNTVVMDDVLESEIVCLVCTSPHGDNVLGLCDSHYFQYVTMCAAGRRDEFVQKMDKDGFIGRVRHRQQYRYKPMYDWPIAP